MHGFEIRENCENDNTLHANHRIVISATVVKMLEAQSKSITRNFTIKFNLVLY